MVKKLLFRTIFHFQEVLMLQYVIFVTTFLTDNVYTCVFFCLWYCVNDVI